jgi:dTDP-glucose 4,6-dehydratase
LNLRLLVTGGAGFIGSNFVHAMLRSSAGYSVTVLDRLTYAGNLENLAGLENNPRFLFQRGDICDSELVGRILRQGIDAVLNFAAESHVDRSILDPWEFARTNVLGTLRVLEACRRHKVARYLQVSTDEVYGSLGPAGFFTEDSPLQPNSPYAASKAAADLLVRSYHHTYGLPALITRCSNNYGPYQFPEKLIPLLVTNALEDRALPIYGDGLNVRDWIHVQDHCEALERILHRGREGEVYNIGARREATNLEIVRNVIRLLGKDERLITFVKDRPGHDRRYAIDPTKLEDELGWKARIPFEEGMRQTVEWYCRNSAWIARVRSGEYQSYYSRMYDNRQRTLSELT